MEVLIQGGAYLIFPKSWPDWEGGAYFKFQPIGGALIQGGGGQFEDLWYWNLAVEIKHNW